MITAEHKPVKREHVLAPMRLHEIEELGVQFEPIDTQSGPFYELVWPAKTHHTSVPCKTSHLQIREHAIPGQEKTVIERRYYSWRDDTYLLSTLSVDADTLHLALLQSAISI